MAATWSEMFPPSPSFTEKDIPSQEGRVFLITGGSAGIGYEVAKALYHLNGRVYITSRTAASAQKAISSIQSSSPHPSQQVQSGSGSIHCLLLDLSDLSTMKSTAEDFLSKEKRLDVIWHNAGTMVRVSATAYRTL
jgi:NAD(P)-dependent dehydrogenase (short-subunit alcohol dehydrogenase family)